MESEERTRRARQYLYNGLSDFIRNTLELTNHSNYHEDTIEVGVEAISLARKVSEWVEPYDEPNTVKHARAELELIGEDPDFIECYLDILRVFASQGHSGGSAEHFIPTLNKLLLLQELAPITDDPAEWEDVGNDMQQNRRNSSLFRQDGSVDYYDVHNKHDEQGNIIWLKPQAVADK